MGGLDGQARGLPKAPGPNPMPQLQKYLTEKGTTFSNAFVHTPICCPSRSSYMTGRYLHNSGTFENDIAHGCSNQTWADGPEKRSFAAHAKAAGYRTSYSGKYLNQYAMPGSPGCDKADSPGCSKHIPAGWDDWHGLHGASEGLGRQKWRRSRSIQQRQRGSSVASRALWPPFHSQRAEPPLSLQATRATTTA